MSEQQSVLGAEALEEAKRRSETLKPASPVDAVVPDCWLCERCRKRWHSDSGLSPRCGCREHAVRALRESDCVPMTLPTENAAVLVRNRGECRDIFKSFPEICGKRNAEKWEPASGFSGGACFYLWEDSDKTYGDFDFVESRSLKNVRIVSVDDVLGTRPQPPSAPPKEEAMELTIKVGQRVRVCDEPPKEKRNGLFKGGSWVKEMDERCGKVGTVVDEHHGCFKVRVDGGNGGGFYYHPDWLTPIGMVNLPAEEPPPPPLLPPPDFYDRMPINCRCVAVPAGDAWQVTSTYETRSGSEVELSLSVTNEPPSPATLPERSTHMSKIGFKPIGAVLSWLGFFWTSVLVYGTGVGLNIAAMPDDPKFSEMRNAFLWPKDVVLDRPQLPDELPLMDAPDLSNVAWMPTLLLYCAVSLLAGVKLVNRMGERGVLRSRLVGEHDDLARRVGCCALTPVAWPVWLMALRLTKPDEAKVVDVTAVGPAHGIDTLRQEVREVLDLLAKRNGQPEKSAK